ncbi:hypothetical protein H4219_002087 [Mycoemilia scoparia]|uniref:Zn(2)-C6 fungal-type domain-containing protein n=1 Tax=Mycoemilia scoparia TaxID=417184 RepID=A0A9W8A4X6_9FUNG|nr:hypothetical protein H4219_002087 [Mycoemilia scoparia]
MSNYGNGGSYVNFQPLVVPSSAVFSTKSSPSQPFLTSIPSVPSNPFMGSQVRLMISCDLCRRRKVRCDGIKPSCSGCIKANSACHYSPVGPRRKPRRRGSSKAPKEDSDSVPPTSAKRKPSTSGASPFEDNTAQTGDPVGVNTSILLNMEPRIGGRVGSEDHISQYSGLSEKSPPKQKAGFGALSPDRHGVSSSVHTSGGEDMDNEYVYSEALQTDTNNRTSASHVGDTNSRVEEMLSIQNQITSLMARLRHLTLGSSLGGDLAHDKSDPSSKQMQSKKDIDQGAYGTAPTQHTTTHCGINITRDLIDHLVTIYFKYSHPMETGMYPQELYEERLKARKVSEPLLLSVLAVASRYSDDRRVQQTPSYLAGNSFYERAKSRLPDLFERDSLESILTLNNLAIYAVGLPVANRSWYFSGIAMRMVTQMSLQKIDAHGRTPGASMLSGPGMESARRAFWSTIFLESLASFASGEPPSTTKEDVHVAEPCDEDGMSTHLAQLTILLLRVSKLNGNRHPESAKFSSEYVTLHDDMVKWYDSFPKHLKIDQESAERDAANNPQLLASKVFIHCVYNGAIIALHQPRVDLVRVDPGKGHIDGSSRGGDGAAGSVGNDSSSTPGKTTAMEAKTPAGLPGHNANMDVQWRLHAQQSCFKAARTITETLVLTQNLDVRYHLVTVGFSIFMAGVVYVTALSCSHPESPEWQFSYNCVKQHMNILEKLGKYFAFHYIMAKHIQAQLSAIQASASASSTSSSQKGGSTNSSVQNSTDMQNQYNQQSHNNYLQHLQQSQQFSNHDHHRHQTFSPESHQNLPFMNNDSVSDIDLLSLLANPPMSIADTLGESMLNMSANNPAGMAGFLSSNMFGQLMSGMASFNASSYGFGSGGISDFLNTEGNSNNSNRSQHQQNLHGVSSSGGGGSAPGSGMLGFSAVSPTISSLFALGHSMSSPPPGSISGSTFNQQVPAGHPQQQQHHQQQQQQQQQPVSSDSWGNLSLLMQAGNIESAAAAAAAATITTSPAALTVTTGGGTGFVDGTINSPMPASVTSPVVSSGTTPSTALRYDFHSTH